MLKGFESNESWSKLQSVIRSCARNLFPKITESKEFLHSYKKNRLTNIYRLLPWYAGERADGFLTPPHLCSNSSAQLRPPSIWNYAPTLRFRSTSLLRKHSSPTPASSMRCRWANQISQLDTGSPHDPSSQHSHGTAKNPDTMSFHSSSSTQKRRPNKQYQIQSPPNSARRILQSSCHKPHQCQHLRRQWKPMHIAPRQIKQWTPQRNWSLWCNSHSSKTRRWPHNSILVRLLTHPNHNWCRISSNLSAHPFQNGTVHHKQHPHSLQK